MLLFSITTHDDKRLLRPKSDREVDMLILFQKLLFKEHKCQTEDVI